MADMYVSWVVEYGAVRRATGQQLAAWGLGGPDALLLLGDEDVRRLRPVEQVAAALSDHDLLRWLNGRERYLLDVRTGAETAGDPVRLTQAEVDATWRQEAL